MACLKGRTGRVGSGRASRAHATRSKSRTPGRVERRNLAKATTHPVSARASTSRILDWPRRGPPLASPAALRRGRAAARMSNCSWAPDVFSVRPTKRRCDEHRFVPPRQPTGRNRRHFRHATVVAGFRDAPPWLTTARGRSPKVRRDASDNHARPRPTPSPRRSRDRVREPSFVKSARRNEIPLPSCPSPPRVLTVVPDHRRKTPKQPRWLR